MNSRLELQDIIDERITKTKAVLDCILAAGDSDIAPDQKTLLDAVWLARDSLQEIAVYKASLNNKSGEIN